MRFLKTLFIPALAAIIVSGSLFAAGGNQAAAGGGGDRFKFSFMANFNQPEAPKDTTKMLQYWKDELKADIEWTWVPNSAYNDKLAAQLAAADLPSVVVVRSPKDAIIVQSVRDGLFWPLDKYVNNPAYPNLDKLGDMRLDNLKIDGKLYAFPKERDIVRSCVYFRQDWMDKLGLKSPTTMEEIYEIIRAFTERDPDGNGRNDTTGISMKGRNLGIYLTLVSIYFGGQHEWYLADDGTIKNEIDHPAYQKALDWYRDVYARGYIISNLVENNDEYIPFQQGRAGFVFTDAFTDVLDARIKLNSVFPNATVGFVHNIGPNGNPAMKAYVGYTGGFMFPRTSIKTEAELDRIMRFFDSLGTDKTALVMRRGFEGEHYSIVNGKLSFTADQLKKFREVDFPDADQITPFYVTKPIPELSSDPLQQAINDAVDGYKGKLYPNYSTIYSSETLIRSQGLTEILQDARMKYVLGQLDLAGWRAAAAQWKAAGGDKIAAEFTAAHKLAQNK
ncbi:MAG: extracellular solute-binding protein [Treponema sp.]|jgi:putative aldouronate transport system substrate-binding protein|nr:extracellular solute-binding protein [Treponema sp.]